MPDVNQIYQSEFLRAEQLKGQIRRATIEAATTEILGQGEKAQQKIVLKFSRVKQRLPLNKTNAMSLSSAWGPMTDNWINRQVDLRPEKVLFSGSMVDAIRAQPVLDKKTPAPQAASAPAATPVPPVSPPAPPLGDAAEPEGIADDIPW